MDHQPLALSDLELLAEVLKAQIQHHHGHAVGYLGDGSDMGVHQLQDERLRMLLFKVREAMRMRAR